MENLKKLFLQYMTELSDDCVMLRIQYRLIRREIESQIKLYQRIFEKHKNNVRVIDTVINMTPIKYDPEKIMQTFMWATLLLLTYTIFSTISVYLLSIFIRELISGLMNIICAYIILPLIVLHYINKLSVKKNAWNDIILRHMLLVLAIIEGLLIGSLLRNYKLQSFPPFIALTPCFIGIITPLLVQSTIKNERLQLLSITIIGSFFCHILIGIIFGLNFPYILLVIFYSAIGFCILQFLIANIDTENMLFTHTYQLAILYFSLLAETFVYKLFGTKL